MHVELDVTAHLAVCWCPCVHVYLSVKRLVDVHSIVFALFDGHIFTFPDEACRRVGVNGAAQKHRLLLVVTATHIADGLVHRQNWFVKICNTGNTAKEQKHKS